MRDVSLTTIEGGLSRFRTKGAAPRDSLYDLLNGFVTTEKTVKVRPGTTLTDTLTAGTKGLVSFDGGFHVFASSSVSVPAGYTLHILRAPDNESLTKIHFAKPFLGVLYVVAEFADGDVYHFWLRDADTWAASTVYEFNELAEPSTPNGFVYRATRGDETNPLWASGIVRVVNDKVEPTTANGFYFEVTTIHGTNVVSGATEPDWGDATEGQLFTESPDYDPPAGTPSTPADPGDQTPPEGIRDRYTRDGFENINDRYVP